MSYLYLDTSAVVKRYLQEAESAAVFAEMEVAEHTGTALVTRAEVVAALARAVRVGRVTRYHAQELRECFVSDWRCFTFVPLTKENVAQAEQMAWKHGLRGYDAVQLASAIEWQDGIPANERPVTFASFDVELRRAASVEGLSVWPELPVEQPWFVSDEWTGLGQDQWFAYLRY